MNLVAAGPMHHAEYPSGEAQEPLHHAMNVWFLHHYAEPPQGQWTATYELARQLVKRGHQVTVFASSFNHYTGKDMYLGPGQRSVTQYFEGVRFILLKTIPYQRNDWRRAMNMLSYAVRSVWLGLRLQDKPQVIIGSAPHPFAPLAAYTLSRVKRARFCFELRDLWPQFLIEVGVLSPRHPMVRVFRWIDRFCLRKAERIITIWPGMATHVAEQGVSAAKVVWVPVGLDAAQFDRTSVSETAHHNHHTFVAMYRGGFGWSNDIKSMLDAAQMLMSQGHNHIKLVLAGDGIGKQEMMQYAQCLGLHNVEFQDFVPKDQLPTTLAQADAFLCSLPGVPHFQKYGQIATKLLDYLSAGRPTVLVTNIPHNVVERAQAGIVVAPGAPAVLAQAIVQLATMSVEERAQMGRNGLAYLRQHHDIAMLAERLEGALVQSSEVAAGSEMKTGG